MAVEHRDSVQAAHRKVPNRVFKNPIDGVPGESISRGEARDLGKTETLKPIPAGARQKASVAILIDGSKVGVVRLRQRDHADRQAGKAHYAGLCADPICDGLRELA